MNNLRQPILLLAVFVMIAPAQEKERMSVSVFGLKSIGIPQDLALSLQEHLESNLLAHGDYDVLSRSDIELLLREARFQLSGTCTDQECAVKAGHILGVEKMITGTISRLGSTYNIVLKLIDIQSARLDASVNRRHCGSLDSLLDISAILLGELLNVSLKKPVGADSIQSPDTLVVIPVSAPGISDSSVQPTISPIEQTIVSPRDITGSNAIVPDTVLPVVINSSTRTAAQENRNLQPVGSGQSKRARSLGIGALILLGIVAAAVISGQFLDS